MSTKKDNKGTDLVDVVEVTGSNTTSSSFLDKNQKMIGYIVGGVFVLASIFFIYKYLYQVPKEKNALNAMFKAEEQFARDSFALALNNPGDGFEGFIDIIENYSGTPAANLAKYYAGISYLNLGNYQEAIDYLNDYSANDEITKTTKLGATGDAYAELEDLEKAMSYYQDAAKVSENGLLKPYYLQKIAMLHYANGDMEKCKEILSSIKTDFPDASEAAEAEKLLARMN